MVEKTWQPLVPCEKNSQALVMREMMTMGQLECILILQCSLLIALRKRYFCVVEFILNENREEESLCAMVAKFLNDNKPKILLQTSSMILTFVEFVKCWWNCLGFNPEGTNLRRKKEICSIRQARAIRTFPDAAMQWQPRNVQKKHYAFAELLFC